MRGNGLGKDPSIRSNMAGQGNRSGKTPDEAPLVEVFKSYEVGIDPWWQRCHCSCKKDHTDRCCETGIQPARLQQISVEQEQSGHLKTLHSWKIHGIEQRSS